MYIDKKNKNFLKLFFDNHYVFHSESFPWQYYNYENGKYCTSYDNTQVRIEFLFGDTHRDAPTTPIGFFDSMIEELDDNIWHTYSTREDFSFYHRQRRYIVQSAIEDNFHNPTHHSFKTWGKPTLDFSNPLTIFSNKENVSHAIITHPGNTRFQSSCFLKKNLNNALIYVKKKNYYDGMFKDKIKRIDNINDLVKLWKPLTFRGKEISREDSNFNFTFFGLPRPDLINGTKYHKQTECNVLKLWGYNSSEAGDKSLLHTVKYTQYAIDSGREIANTWNEKTPVIYTNSDENVKLHFELIRKQLIETAKKLEEFSSKKPHSFRFKFDNIDKFTFDVVKVSKKPKNISELNGNKGYAMWIDKTILKDIQREFYEFFYFCRRDVKRATTKDGRIVIENCRPTQPRTHTKPELEWRIHDEFIDTDNRFIRR